MMRSALRCFFKPPKRQPGLIARLICLSGFIDSVVPGSQHPHLKSTQIYHYLNRSGHRNPFEEGGLGKSFQRQTRHPLVKDALDIDDDNYSVSIKNMEALYGLAQAFNPEKKAVKDIKKNVNKYAICLALIYYLSLDEPETKMAVTEKLLASTRNSQNIEIIREKPTKNIKNITIIKQEKLINSPNIKIIPDELLALFRGPLKCHKESESIISYLLDTSKKILVGISIR